MRACKSKNVIRMLNHECFRLVMMSVSTRNLRQPRDRSSWSFLKKQGETRERYCCPLTSYHASQFSINTVPQKLFSLSCTYLYVFLFCLQQLEQLQKELNFLEEDIKRVEVKYQATHLVFELLFVMCSRSGVVDEQVRLWNDIMK